MATPSFELGALASYRQIACAYLLGLALRNDGRLAAFDRAIPLRAVRGAAAQHLALIPA